MDISHVMTIFFLKLDFKNKTEQKCVTETQLMWWIVFGDRQRGVLQEPVCLFLSSSLYASILNSLAVY